jgi:hypothetical protein
MYLNNQKLPKSSRLRKFAFTPIFQLDFPGSLPRRPGALSEALPRFGSIADAVVNK